MIQERSALYDLFISRIKLRKCFLNDFFIYLRENFGGRSAECISLVLHFYELASLNVKHLPQPIHWI